MTPTKLLFAIADSQGIAVEFHPLPEPLLGHYFAEPGMRPVITLAPELEHREALMRCVLAEELGHHFTCAGEYLVSPYRSYMGRVLLSRVEKRALRWAANLLVPLMELISFKWHSLCDIAEAYNVTPTFLRAVLALPTYVRVLERVQTQGRLAIAGQ